MAKFSFKEAAAKIRALFDDVPAAADPAAADAAKDYTTESGSKLKIDKLEVGGTVYLEDGTTPVTSPFTLSDGTAVEVDDKGVITSVTVPGADAAMTAAPVVPVADVAAMVETEVAKFKTAFTAQTSALTEQLEAEKAERRKDAAKFTDAINQVLTVMEKFAEEPAGDPVQQPSGTPPAETKQERGRRLLMAAQESAKHKL